VSSVLWFVIGHGGRLYTVLLTPVRHLRMCHDAQLPAMSSCPVHDMQKRFCCHPWFTIVWFWCNADVPSCIFHVSELQITCRLFNKPTVRSLQDHARSWPTACGEHGVHLLPLAMVFAGRHHLAIFTKLTRSFNSTKDTHHRQS